MPLSHKKGYTPSVALVLHVGLKGTKAGDQKVVRTKTGKARSHKRVLFQVPGTKALKIPLNMRSSPEFRNNMMLLRPSGVREADNPLQDTPMVYPYSVHGVHDPEPYSKATVLGQSHRTLLQVFQNYPFG